MVGWHRPVDRAHGLRAAWLAGQAGRVSHHGESVHAAPVVAALGLVPADSGHRDRPLLHRRREWRAYKVPAEIKPHFFSEDGIAFPIQGMKHYLAAVVRRDGTAALDEMWDERTELASAPVQFDWEAPLEIQAWVDGESVHAEVGRVTLAGKMRNGRLAGGGGTGIVVTEGAVEMSRLRVGPL
ncbi:MAG: hypothetical protein V3S41_03800 [Spirochaetia bacterium]